MKFLERLFGKKRPELLPWEPLCRVYYSSKGVMVSAVHGDVSGGSPDGPPMVMLSPRPSISEIGEAVIRSLAGSHDGLPTEETERLLASTPHVMGEPNWDIVEKRWDLISLKHQTAEKVVRIITYHRNADGGWLCEMSDPEYSCSLDANEIGELLLRIISGPPPEVLPPDEPSHV
jgi:hypothetical protein